ncbi:MAG TPA: DegQ family serine endoprotease [Candidatus Acidoferrum sp.]|nr:DegQ family serine endoprotease [Candidatus Acidoferrum sp.]
MNLALKRVGLGAVAAVMSGALMLTFPGPAGAAEAPASFADLAAKVTPAVVNISSKHHLAQAGDDNGHTPFVVPKGSPFEDFFKHFNERQRPNNGAESMALGSGFIIDPAGYVVTNNHVVDDATEVSVTLTTGKSYPAKVVGTDKKTDLALLKIDAPTPLPAVSFGDSDAVRIGDWVMAVGNPFGLGGTVTSGIVSARGRDLNSGPFDDFLQIDASINQGNSGGPTFAMNGEVIGINTAIFSPNGGSVGIGFAIPSNLAKPIIATLREKGTIERGWLGVQIQGVTPDIAAALGLDKPEGAIVSAVVPDSPAAKAGLQRGDVILAFDGKPVDRLHDLPRLVAAAAIGGKADVTLWRDHAKQTVTVQVAKLTDEAVAANDTGNGNDNSPSAPESDTVATLGLSLASLTPDLRQQFGIPDTVDGVVVTSVADNGPAAKRGLQPGDVIEQVGSDPVATPEQVAKLAKAAQAEKRNAVLLLVNRRGDELFVAVDVA